MRMRHRAVGLDMSAFPNLFRLMSRQRAALAHEARVIIWRENEANGQAQLEAAVAAGRVGPETTVYLIGWKPVGAETTAMA